MTFCNYETLIYQAFKIDFAVLKNLMFFRIYSTFLIADFCVCMDIPVTPFLNSLGSHPLLLSSSLLQNGIYNILFLQRIGYLIF